jgi:hypothetical protein
VKVKRYAGCALASLAVLLTPVQAQEAAATAQRLMQRSGLSVQLRGFSGQMEAQIRQNPAGLDEKAVHALAEAAKDAFRPESLEEDMGGRVAKKLTVADMNTALAWLDSAPGRRVTQAEEQGSSSFEPQRFQAYAAELKAKPLAAKRAKLISELMAATQAVKALASVHETMALGVALGMDSLQPRELRIGEPALRGRIREVMPPDKVQAMLAQELPAMYAYTYRDVADGDLERYVAFLKTLGGRRYQDAMTAAFLEGLGRASIQLGELMAQRQRQITM